MSRESLENFQTAISLISLPASPKIYKENDRQRRQEQIKQKQYKLRRQVHHFQPGGGVGGVTKVDLRNSVMQKNNHPQNKQDVEER